jgi:phenazine biosynthesis protein phzE
VRAALDSRNEALASFWLQEHAPGRFAVPELSGRSVLIVDNEDAFTSMLAVQLRALGLDVTRTPYTDVYGPARPAEHGDAGSTDSAADAGRAEDFDLVVLGPGPGDPRDPGLPQAQVARRLVQRLLALRRPLLAVCLGHQLLCAELGFELVRLPEPHQGRQIDVDLFGRREPVGFYNSFAALAPRNAPPGMELATAPGSRRIVALRGRALAGVQFHAESIFTRDGLGILRREIERLLE